MTPTTRSRLVRFVGYPAFFSLAFVAMLYLTFPYRQIAGLVATQARKAGYIVTFGSIGPGLTGIKARKVLLLPEKALDPTLKAVVAATPGEAPPMPPDVYAKGLMLEEVVARPSLFPLGVSFGADLFGGTASGSAGLLGAEKKVSVRLKGVDLAKANLKGAVGLDAGGKLVSAVDLKVNGEDFSKTTGRISIAGDGLVVNGGTIANYDLPKIELGHLEGELKFEDGKASVQTFKSTGADVESAIDGEIVLAAKPTFSNLKLSLKFKPAEEWLKKYSFIQAGLSFAMSKDGQGFYGATLGGMLGSPRFSKAPIK